MDNQTPSTSNDTDTDPADHTVTRPEHDTPDTDILAYLDGLVGAAIRRQQTKQKKKQTSEVVFDGEGELIDLAALNLFDVPYYVDLNQPITLPDESD